MNRSPPPHPQDPQEEERPPCKINEREGAVRYRALDRYLPPREEDHNPLYTRNYTPGSFLFIQRSKVCTDLMESRGAQIRICWLVLFILFHFFSLT